MSPVLLSSEKGSMQSSSAMFTHTVKTIKDAAHKNGNTDNTCKRGLRGE